MEAVELVRDLGLLSLDLAAAVGLLGGLGVALEEAGVGGVGAGLGGCSVVDMVSETRERARFTGEKGRRTRGRDRGSALPPSCHKIRKNETERMGMREKVRT